MRRLSSLSLALLFLLPPVVTAGAQPPVDPGWTGTILVEVASGADATLLQLLSDSRLRQSLARLGNLSGRPQPAELLHWIISVDRTKALIEGRWFAEPTADDIYAAFSQVVEIDPVLISDGIAVTLFQSKQDARAYYMGLPEVWIGRTPPP
ncbi:MAG: hypothetical protein HS103_13605 [Anaerolineales bacterium]|nr:hypothetical protein [Anaerolineales bacterium]